jgi:hypothetical protein
MQGDIFISSLIVREWAGVGSNHRRRKPADLQSYGNADFTRVIRWYPLAFRLSAIPVLR